jgi:hypothetical protein
MAYKSAICLSIGFGVLSLVLCLVGDPRSRCSAADTPSNNQSDETKITELLNQQMIIPSGIRYEKTTPELNRKAIDTLANAFITSEGKIKSGNLLYEIVTCGPGLWRKVKDDAQVKKITADLVTLQAVTGNGTRMMTGKLFKGKEQVQVFWQAFLKQYKFDNQATIRRPTSKELQLYWAMIPYDIPEPLFIVQSATATILAQFDKKTVRIGWIDDYSDKNLFKEWLPDLH